MFLLPQMSSDKNMLSKVSVIEDMKRKESVLQAGNKMERGSLGKTYRDSGLALGSNLRATDFDNLRGTQLGALQWILEE